MMEDIKNMSTGMRLFIIGLLFVFAGIFSDIIGFLDDYVGGVIAYTVVYTAFHILRLPSQSPITTTEEDESGRHSQSISQSPITLNEENISEHHSHWTGD